MLAPALVAGAAVAAWVGLVVTGLVVGDRDVAPRPELALRAAPLAGEWSRHLDRGWLPAVALGLAALGAGPPLARRLAWRPLLALSGAATVAWALALAAGRGRQAVSAPLATRFEYLAVVERIEGPGEFLRTFTERLPGYPTHVKGHPPGMPLTLWLLDRLHLQGPGWAAALVLAGAALATAATLVTVRAVAGTDVARKAAPFVAVAPAALWLATSADAFFAGVGAAGVALVVAGRGRKMQVAGGAVLGFALHLTYGAVPLLALPAAVAALRRDVRPLLAAAVGAAAVTGAFAAAGFWWFDGLDATRVAYEAGVARDRGYRMFAYLMNPAALALATGPAVAAGLARTAVMPLLGWVVPPRSAGAPAATPAATVPPTVTAPSAPLRPAAVTRPPAGGAGDPAGDAGRGRRARVWLLPLAAAAAVAVANLSGLSKGEVERIWLPFMPWLLVSAASLRCPRAWLAAQVALALALAVSLDSPW